MEKFNIYEWNTGVGMMSGTSLDGIDIAICSFRFNNNKWEYRIDDAVTFPYVDEVKSLILEMPGMSGSELVIADRKLGKYYGQLLSGYLMAMGETPLFVASHGHTIFHEPVQGMTYQAGHGAAIAAETGLPVVCDFRSSDVALGGQGAPLVPIGDELLFTDFDALVNLGGFANISMRLNNERIAYDICPVNIVLNHFAHKLGHEYDRSGALAASGTADKHLLAKLDALPYYSASHPKSLGREWVETEFLPMIENSGIKNTNDILCTLALHAAGQIVRACGENKSVLFTGGGIKNNFLADTIKESLQERMIIPDETTIDFKEALIFAFMGWLRLNKKPNTIPSATGASKAISAGAVFIP
ncbi:MAG: anhydro-N-acetylmuramic acid kinase [Bacteroidetes bacterium GWF2_43_63]|nr:MAG: anhydro-N-acetylmuramic acid kinase [Bacteroidetes bacterium GWE2_42_42]OFY54689.1 MAG: anhydro-N-acetylmuramic acid kinase [Bacteroidetes bacterium GWF2_43_63]HBG71803.1 anhydro-N-acetylmuramic acid kinase [Bacteroidales bacterium]HCB61386.1 anhydro-N-acetylmuramic acid kinase [Bacteroidales bacterium]HCY23379.1 anhydro-N-acetylmuramic acid kinase [Bacteroidales bacterium]